MAVKTISPTVIEFIWNARDEGKSAEETAQLVLDTKFFKSGPRNGSTKGAMILEAISQAVADYDDEHPLPTRNEIAEQVGCTVSRIAEIIKAEAEHPDVVAFLDITDKAKAEAKAKKEEEAKAKKAEAEAKKAEATPKTPKATKGVYNKVATTIEQGQLPDPEDLRLANIYAEKNNRAVFFPEGLPETE